MHEYGSILPLFAFPAVVIRIEPAADGGTLTTKRIIWTVTLAISGAASAMPADGEKCRAEKLNAPSERTLASF